MVRIQQQYRGVKKPFLFFLIFLFHTSVPKHHELVEVSQDSTPSTKSTVDAISIISEIDKHILTPIETQECLTPKNPSQTNKSVKKKKSWTWITYMAADNDLGPFARKNLKQQADVGSNENINIVTQLDTRVAGNKKITKRYYIEKNKLIVTNQNDPATQKMDSGNPNTLIDCCKWAIKNFPAENYALILWNHGTGELDVGSRRAINPWPLFMFNPENNLIELDRSIPFFDFVQSTLFVDQRAICFDDSTGHYLSNQDLEMALQHVCTNLLHGKKFSLLCFDACLMSMIGIADIAQKYAHYMVASQEVELGTGYDYYKILQPFWYRPLDPASLAEHIVNVYEQTYSPITNDYTQSALNLSHINSLEKNIDHIASLLLQSLRLQKGNTVTEAIKASRHKLFCTHFDETSYLDLHHLYENLLANLKRFSLKNLSEEKSIKKTLQKTLSDGLELITKTVIANKAGRNLARAKGISIYFPERRLHPSYSKTSFAQSNQWSSFVKTYLTFANKGSREVF